MIDSEQVSKIFFECLSGEKDYVIVEGVLNKFGLDKNVLDKHRKEITDMIDELPDGFKVGASFLDACYDKHGNQWTGYHAVMEQLFVLGLGIGIVECLAPRKLWRKLPGGMPYYQVKIPKTN